MNAVVGTISDVNQSLLTDTGHELYCDPPILYHYRFLGRLRTLLAYWEHFANQYDFFPIYYIYDVL